MVSEKQRSEYYRLRKMGLGVAKAAERTGISKKTANELHSKFTRVLVLADLHCGHRAGLTPPDWQWRVENPQLGSWAKQQVEMWQWYSQAIADLQPIDRLIVNGDAVDGKGLRSGSTEHIVVDRDQQVEMAVECLGEVHAPKIIFTRGTPYHTGASEDWENVLAREMGKKSITSIHDQAFPCINGIQFHVKHFQGASSIPHGRFTGKARSKMWNSIWAEHGKQPNVDIFIRSHVHYANYQGEPDWLAISTPALQGWGSKFGQKKCEGYIHVGLLWIDIPKRNSSLHDVEWHWDIPDLECQKVVPQDW